MEIVEINDDEDGPRDFGRSPFEVDGYHDPAGNSRINGLDSGWVVRDWSH